MFIRQVDPFNASDIEQAVEETMRKYQDMDTFAVLAEENVEFLSYMLSLFSDTPATLKAYFGSSRYHLILIAQSLDEEHIAVLQILGLLYVYPLATISLYVTDVKWFFRHHYQFVNILKVSTRN